MHRRSTSYDRYTDDRNYRRTPPNQLRRNPPYKTYKRDEKQQQYRHQPKHYRYDDYDYDPNYTMNTNENAATNYSYYDGFEREYEPIQPTQYRRDNRRNWSDLEYNTIGKMESYPQRSPSPPYYAREQKPRRFAVKNRHFGSENTNNSLRETSDYSDMKSELNSLKTQIKELTALKRRHINTNNNSNNNSNNTTNNTNNAMTAELNNLNAQIEKLNSLKATQSNTNPANNDPNNYKNSVNINKKLQKRIDAILHWIISQQSCAQRKIQNCFKLKKNEVLIVLDILCNQKYAQKHNEKYYLNPKYKKNNFKYNNDKYLQKLEKRFGKFFVTKIKKKKRKHKKKDKFGAPPAKKQKLLEIDNNVIANSIISKNNANTDNNANNDDENNESLDDLFSSQTMADIQQPQPPPPPPRPKSPDMIQYEHRLNILRSDSLQSDSSESSQSDFEVSTDSESSSYESGTESEVHSDSSLASTLSFHSSDNQPAHPPNYANPT